MRALLALPALVTTLAAGEPLALTAPIRSVRVHPDEAWITRSGSLEVSRAGAHKVSVGGLPQGLTLDDLRITARGPAGTRLGDVQVRREPRLYEELPEWKALVGQQAEAEEAVRRAELAASSQARSDQLFGQLRQVQSTEFKRRLAGAGIRGAALEDLTNAVEQRTLELARRAKALGEATEKARQQLGHVQERMEEMRRTAEAHPTRVLAEVETPATGTIDVSITYRSGSASWRPAYEARLNADRSALELVLFALVQQETDEDWSGISLELASEGPAGSLEAPVIPGLPALSHAEGESPRPAPASSPGPESAQASISFLLPGTVDLVRREQQRFRVISEDLAPTFRYLAFPRQGRDVYLLALVYPPPGFPLVPASPIQLLQGSERLGQLALDPPAPGKPLRLSFGAVPGLTSTLATVKRTHGETEDKSKEREWTLEERVVVSNNLVTEAEVEVTDRVVTSSTGSITVDQDSETTPGWSSPAPDLRSWVIKVAPASQTSLDLRTRIRGPLVGKLVNTGDLALEAN